MEFQSSLILSSEIKQTMRLMPCKESRVEVSRHFGQVREPLNERSSLFGEYVEKHRNSELLACGLANGVAIVFCQSDHTGVWGGMTVKGGLGKRTQKMLEGIAKDKGLI